MRNLSEGESYSADHTINNLGVMEENIQDAEANIRDTDIADEMMAYQIVHLADFLLEET